MCGRVKSMREEPKIDYEEESRKSKTYGRSTTTLDEFGILQYKQYLSLTLLILWLIVL